jgi:predicted DNA-binding protein
LSPRTGRPPSEDPKKNQYRIRLTDEDLQMLEYCCEATGLSKAEVIRKGIRKVYEDVKA